VNLVATKIPVVDKITIRSSGGWLAWFVCAVLIGAMGLFLAHALRTSSRDEMRRSLTPWNCIGGCGAGGAGGSAADIKWIGRGESGGLIDAEVMGSLTIGRLFEYKQVKTRLSMKPTWTTGLGLTVPLVSKIGSLQPQTNFDDKTEQTAGIADCMLDFSKALGAEGEYTLSINLSMPTGQYDVKRSKENEMLYLPTTLQLGSGIFNATLGVTRTIDEDKGLWIVEGFLSWPFAVNFNGKNQFVNNNQDQFNALNNRWDLLSEDQKKRFQYSFKPYGENDLGGYVPPSITAALYYGNRGKTNYVYSYGVKIWVPFGVAWVPDYSASTYNPVPDPNNKTWSITLHYGLEFSRPEYPIYLAINKVITSRSAANSNDPFDEKSLARWHGPDMKAMLNDNWIFAAGIKSTMF
jgi:hypothetical protein